MAISAYVVGSRDPSYQTVRLEEYSFAYREIAEKLFNRVRTLAESSRLKQYDGSYSVYGARSMATLAKVIIFEDGFGKQNGDFPNLEDGVYVLLRADRRGDRIWAEILPNCPPELRNRFDRERTLGIAPTHNERFAYLRVSEEDIELLAQVVAACSLV